MYTTVKAQKAHEELKKSDPSFPCTKCEYDASCKDKQCLQWDEWFSRSWSEIRAAAEKIRRGTK